MSKFNLKIAATLGGVRLKITYSDEIVHHEHIGRFDVLVDDRRFLVVAETQSRDQLRCDDSRFFGCRPLASFFLLLDKLDERPAAAEVSNEEANMSENALEFLAFQKIHKFYHVFVLLTFFTLFEIKEDQSSKYCFEINLHEAEF